jgi:hypothetical protein
MAALVRRHTIQVRLNFGIRAVVRRHVNQPKSNIGLPLWLIPISATM